MKWNIPPSDHGKWFFAGKIRRPWYNSDCFFPSVDQVWILFPISWVWTLKEIIHGMQWLHLAVASTINLSKITSLSLWDCASGHICRYDVTTGCPMESSVYLYYLLSVHQSPYIVSHLHLSSTSMNLHVHLLFSQGTLYIRKYTYSHWYWLANVLNTFLFSNKSSINFDADTHQS